MPHCLTLNILRYVSRVKWSNPRKAVVPCSTPWCSSYRKGSLRVTLDYGRQLYLPILEMLKYFSVNQEGNDHTCLYIIIVIVPRARTSHSIRLSPPHSAGPLDYTLYLYRADVEKFKPGTQHLVVRVKETTRERRLRAHPYFSSCILHVLFVRFEWF